METPIVTVSPMAISVCHVAVADLWAGAEVQLKVLLAKLAEKPALRLSVVLFNQGKLEKEIEKLGIGVTVFSEDKWASPRLFLNLIRQFKQAKVQIVHTHKYKDTILAAPAAKLSGVPYVVRTVHGLREPFPGIKAMRMNVYEALEHTVLRCCVDSVVGVSSQVEAKYRGICKTSCIRNGIDLKESVMQRERQQLRLNLGVDSETCLIGTVGRLAAVKGLQYLLTAVQNLLSQHINVKLLIVGDGEMREELESQASRLGISAHAMFLGHRDDTQDLLTSMDIFVLPSLSEGVPMALLEAMAASRPIVASRVGGIPEIVTNGVEGFLVEPTDVQGLVDKCLELIRSQDLANKMGELARKRVEQDFSATAMADQVSSLYRDLVTSHKV
jgi:glycosyltransferase involved in cell wall biosynthesis